MVVIVSADWTALLPGVIAGGAKAQAAPCGKPLQLSVMRLVNGPLCGVMLTW